MSSASVSKDEVSDLIRENNKQLMDSFKDLLAQCVGQIKRSNEDSAKQQMKAIKKLKYDEPHKFKKKANEDQFNFNRKLAENIGTAKSAAEIGQLEKVKSDLAEDPRPLEPRRRPQVRSFQHQPLMLNVPGFPSRRPNTGTCFACGKPGHWRSCCPTMAKQTSHTPK